MAAKLRVTLVKSPISHTRATRGTVRALGLHRLGETVEVPDNPQTRGMARAIRFLVRTEEVAGADAEGRAKAESVPASESAGEATSEAPVAASRPPRRRSNKEESTA